MITTAIKVTLPQICELVTDGTHDSPKLQTAGIPFIKGKHISSGRIDFANCDYITEQDHSKCVRRVKPKTNDVLFSNIGSVGDAARVTDDVEFSIKNVALFRPDDRVIDPVYFYYLVISPYFRGHFLNVISGSAQPFISLESFRSLEFTYLANRAIQNRVGQQLSAYDDLLENNARRIKLLEESARLLYEEWFVRLRFPGHEHTPIHNALPKGWQPKVLCDLCQTVRETVHPNELEPDTPYIGLEHIPRRSITLGTWGRAEDVDSTKHRFRAGDILFGKIRAYFHKVGITLTDGIASSDAIVIRPESEDLLPLVLMTTSSDHFVRTAAQTAREGSKMPRADWKLMQQFSVPLPPTPVLKAFNDFVTPILRQLKAVTFANQKLQQARDLLLPRLMNGEIMV